MSSPAHAATPEKEVEAPVVEPGRDASEGEIGEDSDDAENPDDDETASDAPPLPNEPIPDGKRGEDAPPLPNEPVPEARDEGDDGWDCQWDANTQAWFFHNRFTGKTQWENPRVPSALPQPPADEKPAAGGYNPAIHGDYDPNAWYAQGDDNEGEEAGGAVAAAAAGIAADQYGATVGFNRFHGEFQSADAGPERHSDEAKARRQMNAFFDVDAAANAHGGRSLKAERSNKKPTKSELKAFKEKRRARKEEKRRAWLRD